MYPVSARFLAALRKSHTELAHGDLYRQGELIFPEVPIVSGQVTDDSSALIRRRMALVLPATSEVLEALASTPPDNGGLWPLGNELKIHTGIQFGPGDEELVPLGLYRISKPVIADTPEGPTVNLEGYDRSRSVSRAKFTQPYVIAVGTNYATAIKDLIKSRIATLTDADFILMSTDYTTPQLVFTIDDDPMEMAIQMASSMGAELFFDGDGKCVLRPEPDPLFDPSVFDYIEGEEATLTAINRDLDDELAYNGAIVVSENSELPAPLRAEAWDTTLTSPTYYDPAFPSASVYGAVPYSVSTQYITTQEQCQDAANAELARRLGVIEQLQFNAVNNPAHQSGDIVTVGRAAIGASGVNILDNFTLTFGEGSSMAGATRKRRT